MKTITKLVLACLVSGIVAGSYWGYNYYQEYQMRYLQEAKSKIDIDDRAGAIAAYRAHILENPEDFDTRLKLAGLLHKIGDIGSAIRVYRRVMDTPDYRSSVPPFEYFQALRGLNDAIKDSCAILDKIAVLALERGNTTRAVDLYESLVELREESPAINMNYIQAADTNEYSWLSSFNKFTLDVYKEDVAQKAYALWRAGSPGRAQATITIASTNYSLVQIADSVTAEAIALELAILLANYGHNEFNNQNWESAVDAFNASKKYFLKVSDGSYSLLAAESHYNQAVSEYNRNNYNEVAKLFRELKNKLPWYNPEKINELLSLSIKYSR